MRLRYRIPLVIIAIFMVMTLFMASSYALWKVTIYQETENLIESGCFSIEFQEDSPSIHLDNTYPMSNESGMKTIPYLFTVKNTCTVDAKYTIYLNTLEVEGVKLEDSLINYSLVREDGALATAKTLTTAVRNIDTSHFTFEKKILKSYGLETGTLKGKTDENSDDGEVATYSLRLWINESGTNSIMGQTFEAGVSVIASATNLNNLTVKYVLNGVTTWTAPSKDSGYELTDITCTGVNDYSWDNANWKLNYSERDLTSEEASCTITFARPLFSDYLINLSNTDSSSSIVKDTHDATTQTGSNATIDYRYIGADPKNYVCLEESGSCTDDQLYRIIGVIPTQSTDTGDYENRVKLIKYTNYGTTTYAWGSSNNWTASTLNTTTLNQTYWNSISSYQKYIGDTKWYLGGASVTGSSMMTAILYNSERGTTKYSSNSTSTIAKIGLMYASDFAFATSGGSTYSRATCLTKELINWDTGSYPTNCRANDWLYNSSGFWTLTHYSSSNYVYYWSGGFMQYSGSPTGSRAIKPVFYLKNDVAWLTGDGSKTSPYQIVLG